ncbi:hypothetical protein B0H16DRAFT_1327444 [Mycena metata]|uniref:Uncharacterized protein n=1 Tax=Mycena metata TaxID=1033252 RepID=A0AAD7MW00_9AGAR|nr:hypothetical protein B0H16DRAFT_1327444 [Mycena metata]
MLQKFYPDAFDALAKEKEWFLEKNPDLLYPSTSSVFSAATFELGGPHCRTVAQGVPHCFLPGALSILTVLGNYNHNRGGHVILWELGFVVCFPPGVSIIIPTGVVHYSFVRICPSKTRYSLLQWAGSGIARYMRNGFNFDSDFTQGSREQHAACEEHRQAAHAAALDAFPLKSELDYCAMSLPFFGIQPTTANNH